MTSPSGYRDSVERSVPVDDRSLRSNFRLSSDLDYHHFVDGMFLGHVLEEKLTTIRGDSWITSAGADAVPGDVLAQASYFHAGRFECLVRLDSAVAHLILHELALTARVAAVDATACDTALAQVRTAMSEDGGAALNVPVRFWWWE
jgi:hypothetical protein